MAFLRRILFILFVAATALVVVAQVASNFFLKPILEREARRVFQVPIYIDRAGANLFVGSFWMKGVRVKNTPGFKEQDILTARTISVDFNLLSFLTNEFAIGQVLFKDPHFNFEINHENEWNISSFIDRMSDWFQEFARKKPAFARFAQEYTLEKFSVRNGTVHFIDQRGGAEKNWTFHSISFSLARIVYPPDPEEALPTAIYVNATPSGPQEAKILVLGRLNPFAPKKSFDITGSAKSLALSQYVDSMPDFPLHIAEGNLQLKVKALCHENQVDIHHQVHVEGLKFQVKEISNQQPLLILGLPQETVVHFFNSVQPPTEPFEFDFRVTGDLSDPKFKIWSAIEQKISEVIYGRVTQSGDGSQPPTHTADLSPPEPSPKR